MRLNIILDVLVAPIRVAKRLEDLKVAEVADLFQTAVKVQKIMEAVHESESSTICVQDGKYAGQTVAVGIKIAYNYEIVK